LDKRRALRGEDLLQHFDRDDDVWSIDLAGKEIPFPPQQLLPMRLQGQTFHRGERLGESRA
jgi:hypothetical protein